MKEAEEIPHHGDDLRWEGLDSRAECIQSTLRVLLSGTGNKLLILVGRKERNTEFPKISLQRAGHSSYIQFI